MEEASVPLPMMAPSKKKAPRQDTQETLQEEEIEEVPVPPKRVRGPNRPKMVDLWKAERDEKALMDKIKSTEITFTLAEIIALSPSVAKYFSKPLSEEDVLKFRVNNVGSLQTVSADEDSQISKFYSRGSPRAKVTFGNRIKITALLDSEAEINVMIRSLARDAQLKVIQGFRLRLIFHTGHEMDFEGVCLNVPIDVGGIKTKHHVFVVPHADHQLVLGQPFLQDVSINYDYAADGHTYAIISNPEKTKSAIFKCLDKRDSANRTEADVFPSSRLN